MAFIPRNPISPPNLDELSLIADIQAFEPFGSAALNRKMYGLIREGVFYKSFIVEPAQTGVAVTIKSEKNSSAAVNVGGKYVLTVTQQNEITIPVPAGESVAVCLKAFYAPDLVTNQVDTNSDVMAAEIVVAPIGREPENSIILADVNAPFGTAIIDEYMIDINRRQYGSIGDYVLKTQMSNDIFLDSKLHVPTSHALTELRKLLEQVDSKSVKYWSYACNGGEDSLKIPFEALGVDSVCINGVRQSEATAFLFNTATNSITFAEPLDREDRIDVAVGAVSQNIHDAINDLIKRIEDLEANGGGSGGDGTPMRIYNTQIPEDGDKITIPSFVRSIKLVFLDGVQQTETLSYIYQNGVLVLPEGVHRGTHLTVVYQ